MRMYDLKKAAAAGGIALLAAIAVATPRAAAAADNADQYRRWIVEMKDRPRGPFSGIKWYCKDGSVFPQTEYACAKHGGGVQHVEWSDRTRQMRAQGYKVAPLLAGIDAAKAVGRTRLRRQLRAVAGREVPGRQR